MIEKINWKAVWTVRKYHTDEDYASGVAPYETVVIDGNLLLNEGIDLLLDLLIGETGTAYQNGNSMLGVGDSSTAAQATDTGLLGPNILYKGMEATYPSRAAETISFRSVYEDGDANWAWAEFSASNSVDDTGINLNRKVQDLGVKASGTWTLDLDVTIS